MTGNPEIKNRAIKRKAKPENSQSQIKERYSLKPNELQKIVEQKIPVAKNNNLNLNQSNQKKRSPK